METTPNVNFFIHSVPNVNGMGINDKNYLEYVKLRKFYGCEQSYNIVQYVKDGSEKKIDIVDYSGKKEKSRGIFDKNGLCNDKKLIDIRQLFRTTKSPIWYGLISFEELFGKKYCGNYEQAYELMKSAFPKFLKSTYFNPDNVVWFAGLHENTDNMHIHFCFCEKKPTKFKQNQKGLFFSNPTVSRSAFEKAKINIEMQLKENNYFIGNARKELTTKFKENLKHNLNKEKNYKLLQELIKELPTSGRTSYDSDGMVFLTHKIDYYVDQIIKNDSKTKALFITYLSIINDKDTAIKELCKKSKIDPNKVVVFKKYQKDLYRRLGNAVINSIKHIRNENSKIDFQTKNRLLRKRIDRKLLINSINESLYLDELVRNEAQNCFKDHMKKLEELRIKVLIEQGVIEL